MGASESPNALLQHGIIFSLGGTSEAATEMTRWRMIGKRATRELAEAATGGRSTLRGEAMPPFVGFGPNSSGCSEPSSAGLRRSGLLTRQASIWERRRVSTSGARAEFRGSYDIQNLDSDTLYPLKVEV
jgi:hypothetical protein